MSHTDKLKYARWKQVEKNNPQFEEPTDPFHTPSRRFRLEFDRYMQTVNLNYMPPMPRPPPLTKKTAQQEYYDTIKKSTKQKLRDQDRTGSASNLTTTDDVNRSSQFS